MSKSIATSRLVLTFLDSQLDTTFTILVGKNAKANWQLIDEANPDDIWIHLDDGRPSPHIIIQNPDGLKPSLQTIKYGALQCKIHSKFANQSKLPIMYTPIKNVIKGDKVGSVLLKSPHKTLTI